MMTSDTKPRMSLPAELMHEFLQYLDEDTESLRNCSLVSTSWTPSSRHVLFNHLNLDLSCLTPLPIQKAYPLIPARTSSRDCMLLEEKLEIIAGALEHTSYLSSCVRSLTLSILNYSDPMHPLRGGVAQTLIKIIGFLTSIKSLNMVLGSWHNHVGVMKSTCLNMLETPSLGSVTIRDGSVRYAADITIILQSMNQVEDLRVKGITCDFPTKSIQADATSAAPSSTFTLKRLQLCCDSRVNWEIYLWLSQSFTKITLEALSVSGSLASNHIRAIQCLLKMSGPDLQMLEFTVNPPGSDQCKPSSYLTYLIPYLRTYFA